MPPQVRGGLHARIAAAALADAQPETPSRLAALLLNSWVWGDMSALQIQRFAEAAVADGAGHRELQLLASIGSHGTMPNNCHRDLVQYRLRKPEIHAALNNIDIWVRKPPLHTVQAHQKILLPHELMAAIHEHHPDAFTSQILGGGPARISVALDDPWVSSGCIHIEMHGGGGHHPDVFTSNIFE